MKCTFQKITAAHGLTQEVSNAHQATSAGSHSCDHPNSKNNTHGHDRHVNIDAVCLTTHNKFKKTLYIRTPFDVRGGQKLQNITEYMKMRK